MIIKVVIVVLFLFQIILGQEDPEQDLRDLIEKTNEELNEYINPLLTALEAFGYDFINEDKRLQSEYVDLRNEIFDLALALSDENQDVTVCLNIALQDASDIFVGRADEMAAFHRVSFNTLNQIFNNDLTTVIQEQQNLIRETQDSIETCRALSTTEEVNACYNALLPIFDAMKEDILNRIVQISKLGQSALLDAENQQRDFNNGNREFVRQSSQTTRLELTRCIQNLSS